jgi:hypothetical protein
MKVQLSSEEFCGIVNILAENDALEELRENLKTNKLVGLSEDKLTITIDEKYVVSALVVERKYFPSIIGMGKALMSTLKHFFEDIIESAEARRTELRVEEAKENV